MKLSTRARYGMRMMLTLAVNYGRGSMYLKEIAEAEDVSEKYLSLLVIPLRRAGLFPPLFRFFVWKMRFGG